STGRSATTLPACWAGLSAAVAEFGHRLLPGEFLSVSAKLVLPELSLPVATGIYKSSVLSIRDLVAIDQKLADYWTLARPPPRDPASRDEAHLVGPLASPE